MEVNTNIYVFVNMCPGERLAEGCPLAKIYSAASATLGQHLERHIFSRFRQTETVERGAESVARV